MILSTFAHGDLSISNASLTLSLISPPSAAFYPLLRHDPKQALRHMLGGRLKAGISGGPPPSPHTPRRRSPSPANMDARFGPPFTPRFDPRVTPCSTSRFNPGSNPSPDPRFNPASSNPATSWSISNNFQTLALTLALPPVVAHCRWPPVR